MMRQAILAMAAILSLGPITTLGLCQGAAEYAITTSHVAGAAIKGGTGLDKVTQQVAGRLQQKLSKSTEQSRPTPRQPSLTPGDHPVSTAQSVGSAHGMEIISGSTNANTGTKKSAELLPPPCASSPERDSPKSKATLPCKAETQEKYPSVVNLSFGKQ